MQLVVDAAAGRVLFLPDTMDFDDTWRASIRYRHASRETEPLLKALHAALVAGELAAVKESLVNLLAFLASGDGRTDANCATVHYFVAGAEPLWSGQRADVRAILDDMSGTLRDSIYAPQIARTFESTPEQLLERASALVV